MYLAKKVRIIPTPEQENLLRRFAGAARWTYNKYLYINQLMYDAYKEIGGERYSAAKFRKELTQLKKTEEYAWLNDISSNVIKQAVRDADNALSRFIKGKTGVPKFKSRKHPRQSFYVNYESLKRTDHGFQGEKLGILRTSEPLPKVKTHYSDPRITCDGKFWYLSVGYSVKSKQEELADQVIGIDLGIKELAVLSTGKIYPNINKTKRVRMLEKRLKRAQRRLSRKDKTGNNYLRQVKIIRLLYKHLYDIRQNYLHQTTTEIVKTKPSVIVMEDLNVQGLMKNRHLARAIAEQKWYEFRRQISYKCELYGIQLILADRFYPSSKTCSGCGYYKRDLKLNDRVYICPECGLKIDRDLNAAINLAKLPVATGEVKPAERYTKPE